MNLKTFAAALTAATIAGSAFAADLPSRKVAPAYVAPVPVFTWTGFYVGVNVGYGFGGSNSLTGTDFYLGNYPATVAGINTGFNGGGGNLNGILGGAQIGYNWQMNSLVLGLEADIQGAGLKSSNALGPFPGNPALGFIPFFTAGATSQKVDWFGTLRGRLGFTVTPTLLAYVTGGLAYGDVKNSLTYTAVFPAVAGAIFTGTNSTTSGRIGWTVGAGGEWAFSPNWSMKLEYLYTDLGNSSVGTVTAFGPAIPVQPLFAPVVSRRTAFHTVRAGLNYRFGWASAPVVAKY